MHTEKPKSARLLEALADDDVLRDVLWGLIHPALADYPQALQRLRDSAARGSWRRAEATESELAQRRAAAEDIKRRVEQIRERIGKEGPPTETIVDTLRRLRGGWPDDGSA